MKKTLRYAICFLVCMACSEDDDAFNTVYVEGAGNFFFITDAFNPDGTVRQIRLEANQNTIEEGVTYPLGVAAPGGYFGEVLFFHDLRLLGLGC